MSLIEITDVDDVRAGDLVTLSWKGHEFTGLAWTTSSDGRYMYVGPDIVSDRYGGCEFVKATREGPQLPTEPNSVIVDVTTTYGDKRALMVRDEDGEWRDALSGDAWSSVEIKSWTPAKIVKEVA